MTGEVVGGGGRHTEEPGTPCPHQPGPPDTGASHEEGSSSLLDTQTSGCPPPSKHPPRLGPRLDGAPDATQLLAPRAAGSRPDPPCVTSPPDPLNHAKL